VAREQVHVERDLKRELPREFALEFMQTKTEWISSRQSVVNFVFNERLLPVHQTLPRGQLHTLN